MVQIHVGPPNNETVRRKVMRTDIETGIMCWDWKDNVGDVLDFVSRANEEGYIYIYPVPFGLASEDTYYAVFSRSKLSTEEAMGFFFYRYNHYNNDRFDEVMF